MHYGIVRMGRGLFVSFPEYELVELREISVNASALSSLKLFCAFCLHAILVQVDFSLVCTCKHIGYGECFGYEVEEAAIVKRYLKVSPVTFASVTRSFFTALFKMALLFGCGLAAELLGHGWECCS